jgi:hypothetical protein
MAKKKPLTGYKQEGKRFIPPMKQLPQMEEASFVDDLLPELIWLGLIHERKSYQFGARALEAVVEVAKKWPEPEKPTNLALQSAYAKMPTAQKNEILDAWKARGFLDDIQHALAPLVLLYDGFSLAFVGPPTNQISQEVLIQRIRDCVGNHMDRRETPAIVLYGTMLLTRLAAGKIKIASHIDFPDLNAVIEKPGSDEAKRAAGFIRASVMAEVGFLELAHDWAQYFWNRGAELSPCELPEWADFDD